MKSEAELSIACSGDLTPERYTVEAFSKKKMEEVKVVSSLQNLTDNIY